MDNPRRIRIAADVALGYAADDRGNGVAYVSVATGTGAGVVRLTFRAAPVAGLEGREQGYAAIAAVAQHLKTRGFGRLRLRVADAHVVAELSGGARVPRALAMSYVHVRCLLRGLGAVRLELAEPIEIRDLVGRATADVTLHVAA